MGGRSTRAGGSKKVGMEIVKFDHHANKVKEEESPPPPPPLPPPPHLSGAYIRSLVKQLTSSRNKDVPSPDVDGVDNNNGDGFGEEALVIEDGSCCQQSPIQPQASDQALVQQQQQQQHKKQVRRRLHTTRPYQERLLNMAEARREIVTALKFHRASMKQSTEQHHRQPTPPPPVQPQLPQPSLQPPPPPPLQSSSFRGRTKCRRNRRVYPSTSASCVESNFSYHPAFGSSSLILPNSPYCWPSNSHEIPPPHPAITGNLMNLGLPNQRPLGLNLNIHDFTNFEATLYHHNPSSFSTCPSPIPNNNLEAISKQQQQGNSSEIPDPNSSTGNGGGMQQHQGMDEEEIMSEMEWMGEQHQMEWNDTMNLVTSAWWFKFFKTAGEIGPKYKGDHDGDKEDDPFDQAVVEFPDWLNTANDQSCFHHCLDESSQDPALPCMDIGEIEGMDEEWLP
ncbi:hypothetical protein RHMOL_Rhmol04G0260600 [Rhododendron molle]|uniref:Uncharacterized protein n=1 Tax=Rhododendron molle TaxID=49168 RepID=A0ACC0P4B3_RHOML|nr:hypothetical protein RHMOL_Rhmol04G0260600 [Rhododendron molle]